MDEEKPKKKKSGKSAKAQVEEAVAEVKAKAGKKLREIRDSEKGKKWIGRAEQLAGAAAAGAAEGYGIRLELGEDIGSVPMGIPVGVGGVILAEVIKSDDVGNVAMGSLNGGVALLVAEKVKEALA